ncbi:hypothetical protein QFZ64_002029 [Streptomyces sp. B3I8]|nr:hypothetical protein [Streptomyces sp. B3I8]
MRQSAQRRMGLPRPGRTAAQPRRPVHPVPADRRFRLRGLHPVPRRHPAPPQAGRVDPQPGARRSLPGAARPRHDPVRGPPLPAELGLPGPHRRVRRRTAGRPPRVLRQGGPRQPPARRGRRGRRAARQLAAGRAAGDGHQPGAGRGPFDLPRTLALRHPAADLGRRRQRPVPRRRHPERGRRRDQRAQYGAAAGRRARRVPGPPCRGPAHRRGRAAAARTAGAARRAGLARVLRAAPGEERGVVADREGGGGLPRRRRGLAGLRRSARGPRRRGRAPSCPGSPRPGRTAGPRR